MTEDLERRQQWLGCMLLLFACTLALLVGFALGHLT
jgi:hypothetical protein